MRDLTALGQYALAATVVGLSATALVSAIVLRAMAGELARRGLGLSALPTLRSAWLVLGCGFILVGFFWALDAAGIVDAGALQRFGLPVLLIVVGVVVVTLYRRGLSVDLS